MQSSNKMTSAKIDTILKILATGSLLSAAMAAPNIVIALDKPLRKFFDKMDKRERERQIKKTLYYMKRKDLISVNKSGTYMHGLNITKSGKKRLDRTNFVKLLINTPTKWDRKWRIVLFDIPQEKNYERILFTNKIKSIGLRQLQRSVWIYPFSCKEEVLIVSSRYGISNYITYIETGYIDNQEHLIAQFKRELKLPL